MSSRPNSPSQTPNPSSSHTTSGGHFAVHPSGVRLTQLSLNDNVWPSDLILDLGKSNWMEWSRKLELLARRYGFRPWLEGSLSCPNISSSPDANYIWTRNDDTLGGFIIDHVSPADVHLIDSLPSAHAMFEKLRVEHEQLGAFAQINLLIKALRIELDYETDIRDKVAEMRTFYQRIISMGKIKEDDIFTVILLHSMNKNFGPLQQNIHSLSSTPGFNSATIVDRLLQEAKLIRDRVQAGQSANPYLTAPSVSTSSAFPATSIRPRFPRPVCANCKREGHGTDFCVAPNGKMAGRTLDEARAAYRASLPKNTAPDTHLARSPRTTPHSAHVATSPSPTPIPSLPSSTPESLTSSSHNMPSSGTVFVNGLPYIPDPGYNSPVPDSAHITELPSSSPDFPYRTCLALSDDEPHFEPLSLASPSNAFSVSVSTTSNSSGSSLPFIIDTGATCHISPILSDFHSLKPITPHPIRGLGDHSIDAVGMGTIFLASSTGTLALHNAFYVPHSAVRLISVYLLGNNGYSAHFHPRDGYCFISSAQNTIIARGKALPNRKLFVLSDFSVQFPDSPSTSLSAHYASRSPDIDTWHKRLGHCGSRTVLDMARSKVVEGMPLDTSSTPSKCEHCILGKQTRSSVPRVREGARATKALERIYVDLCGPMSIPSRSGRLYSMNIIDDYSSFVWSLPLRSKDEAAPILRNWLTALEVQTSYRLQSFVTDNGELASLQVQNWCTDKGILHLFTAPYTSAHNGRAERLHRTLLDKARAMRSACNSPANMWDEFCATAAYLTNLTGASANEGKTPYELWYNRKPSLSHLREIGCRAFALIPSNNPKIFPRSLPCTLIGYAPNSKAYRLWDRSADRIFNSFHVSFIEYRELPPPPPPTLPQPTQHYSPIPLNRSLPLLPIPPPILRIPTPTIAPAPNNTTPTNAPQTIILPSTTRTSHNPVVPQPFIVPPQTSHQNTVLSLPTVPLTTSPQHTVLPQTTPQHTTSPPTVPPPTSNTNTVNPQPPVLPQTIVEPQNTVNPQNTVIPQNNDRPQNTVASTNRTITNNPAPTIEQNNNLINPNDNNTTITLLPSSNLVPNAAASSSLPTPNITITPASNNTILPLPTTPAHPTTLRRSPRLAAVRSKPPPSSSDMTTPHRSLCVDDSDRQISAFLAEYAPVRDTHCLLPLALDVSSTTLSVPEVLAALSTGDADITLDDDDDPSWSSALASSEREYWIAGARDELKSLADLNVFVLVPRSELPRGQRPLKGKLVCKRKRDDAGNIARYKVRYVAKGFAQRYLVDYDKTTAPTAQLESFRSLLHIAAVLDWEIHHVDIKTAFLHGVLPASETVFMEQPPGFETPGKEDWVWRLVKSLYGMKQASRIWNQTFHKTVTTLGFKRLVCEWCVYHRHTSNGTTIFAVHVDDIIVISSSPDEISHFKSQLRQHWEISDLGSVKYTLGIGIARDRSTRTISLSQTALIDRVVEQFGQTDAHPVDTPMVAGLQIVRPDKTLPTPSHVSAWSARTPYRSLVGTLNYLAVATRPDIAFAVGRLATVLDCYQPEHWDAAVRVVRYLKGTRLFSLRLGGTNPIKPIGFSDSDYANCPTSSRSIGGYCFSLGSGMVSWASHKQPHTADSSCYAEYISLHDASHEVIFLRQLLEGLNMLVNGPTPLYCNNDAARQLTEDQRWHAKVRHFRVKYHSTRDLVDADELKVIRVRTSDNTADILTKSLTRPDFQRLRSYLGIRPPSET